MIFRLQNVYGPGQSLTNPYTGIVSLFAQLAKAGEVIPVYEDGEIIRDFVFIDDVAAAVLPGLLHSPATVDPWDIGSGEATSILRLAELVAEVYDAPAPRITGQFRNGDVRAAQLRHRRGHRRPGLAAAGHGRRGCPPSVRLAGRPAVKLT